MIEHVRRRAIMSSKVTGGSNFDREIAEVVEENAIGKVIVT